MAKYLRKRSEIDAFKYDGDLMDRNGVYYIPDWAQSAFNDGLIFYDSEDAESPPLELFVKTPLGVLQTYVGDYIVKTTYGELTVMRSYVFEKEYDEIVTEIPASEYGA